MIQKRIAEIKKYTEMFKPKLEEMIGLKTGPYDIQEESKLKAVKLNLLFPNYYACCMKNTIRLNPFRLPGTEDYKKIVAVHELVHSMAHNNNDYFKKIKQEPNHLNPGYICLDEGFAVYVSLDLFKNNYGKDISEEIRKTKNKINKVSHLKMHREGYRIVKGIVQKNGLKNVIKRLKILCPVEHLPLPENMKLNKEAKK